LGFPRGDGKGAEARENNWGFHVAPEIWGFRAATEKAPKPGKTGASMSRLKFGVSTRRRKRRRSPGKLGLPRGA